MMFSLFYLLCSFLLQSAPLATPANTITVTIIDAKTGLPDTGYRVALYKLDDEGGMSSDKGFPIQGVTDATGIVRLRVDRLLRADSETEAPLALRRPLTIHYDAEVIVLSPVYQCSDARFSLHEVMASGMVEKITDPRCKKFDTTKIHASPGDLIMFVRKIGWGGGQR